tara:strand:+ start:40 stop:516 length:477 start_codon:yes stop_codon:yes gene_type:complete
MIDPISAITLATSAYKGIKKAVEVGKEISSFTGAISQFAKASSDIDFLEKKSQKPSLYHKLFSNTEATALDIWSAKKKLEQHRTELKNHISFVYGPSAWKEIVRIEAQQRKQQRALVYERQEFIDNLINGIIITIITVIGLGICGVVIYFVGKSQGKW